MAVISKTSVKAYFETGDFPTQAEFVDLIDSYQDRNSALDTILTQVSGAPADLFVLTDGLNAVKVEQPASARAIMGLGSTDDVTFNTITVSGASVQDFVASGNINLTGTIKSDVTVSADATFKNITVSGQASFGGTVSISAAGIAMGGNTLNAARLEDVREVFVCANATALYTVDVQNAMVHKIVITAATCSLAFANFPASGTYSGVGIVAVQDATGGRKLEYPAAVKWADGATHELTSAANSRDRIEFETYDGGTVIDGFVAGKNFS